jgi:hypothetical protein
MAYRSYYRNRFGFLILGVFLILWGLQAFGVNFSGEDTVLAILAIVAGILIIINR